MTSVEKAMTDAGAVGRVLFFPELLFGVPDPQESLRAFDHLATLKHVIFKTPTPVMGGHPSNTNAALIEAHRWALHNGFTPERSLEAFKSYRPNMLVVYPEAIRPDLPGFFSRCEGCVDSMIFVEGVAGQERALAERGFDAEDAASLADRHKIALPRIVYTGYEHTFEEPVRSARGFLYLAVAPATGGEVVTGADVARAVDSIKRIRDIPILAGFGIQSIELLTRVASVAGINGVTIGNWLLRSLLRGYQDFCSVVAQIDEALDRVSRRGG